MSADGEAPPARRYGGLQDYWNDKLNKLTNPGDGENGADGFPTIDEELLELVDEIIAAFKNIDDIIEETENRHVRFARSLTHEQAEEKAWDTIVSLPYLYTQLPRPPSL